MGSDREILSDFRVISATNQDLETLVSQGRFRRDLLFRLNSFTLTLPPLRDRGGDVFDIARHYADHFCRQNNTPPKEFSQDFVETLERYDWPGNARELVNVMDVIVASTFQEDILFAYHLPQAIRTKVAQMAAAPFESPKEAVIHQAVSQNEKLKDLLERTERTYLSGLYKQVQGDIRQLCELSGISRAVLYRKLKKHNIR